MATIVRFPGIQALLRLAPFGLIGACAGTPPAALPVQPIAGATYALRQNWRAQVVVDRDDSIILVLPSGDRQLQQFQRHAVFHLGADGNGNISLQLESLTVSPPQSAERSGQFAAAAWTGRANDPRVNAFRVAAGGETADELTSLVRNLLPRLPAGGVRTHSTWTDSATGTVRVDVFSASERRQAQWTAGLSGGDPSIRVQETYEQLGSGMESGRRVTMTAQGSRTGTYYCTQNGQLTSATLADSTAMLIAIPDMRQVVPTTRFGRTSVRFVAIPQDGSY